MLLCVWLFLVFAAVVTDVLVGVGCHTSCVNIWMCSKHVEVSKKCFSFAFFVEVKMGVRLCYKWDEPKSVVKVAERETSSLALLELNYQPKSWINSIHLLRSV